MATEPTSSERRWLIGPADNAQRLLLVRSEWESGFFVGLHRHDGEEAFYVLDGEVRFTVDGAQTTCRAGDAAMVPTGAEHGFLVLEDARLLIIREQELESIAIVIDPDGSRREVEIFQYGPPWSKKPPGLSGLTPSEAVRALYHTTKHVL